MRIKSIETEFISMKLKNPLAVNNSSAKAAVDMTIYDLFGKRYNIHLYKFLEELEGKLNITKADLDAIALFEEEPILGGVELKRNKLIIADEPGLGISGINYKGGVVQ